MGTVLRDAGHEAVVYDADFNENPRAMDYQRLPDYYPEYLASFRDTAHPVWQEVRRTVGQFKPDVIGISIWTAYAASAFHIAGICKAAAPDCPVVAGGPHATARAEEVLTICPAIDYVIRGEGEIAMRELADEIAGHGPGLSAIQGLSFRSGGLIRHNPAREPLRDLREIPTPDRTILMNERTYGPEDMGLIMTSRGCPFSCSFCATQTRQVRYQPIDSVLTEIRQVQADYGTTQFSFKDDSFTVNKRQGGRVLRRPAARESPHRLGVQHPRGPCERGSPDPDEAGRLQQREGGNRIGQREGAGADE